MIRLFSIFVISMILATCIAGCTGAGAGFKLWPKPPSEVDPLLSATGRTVQGVEKADIWAERVLSAGMVLGGVGFVIGLAIAVGVGNVKTGLTACVTGLGVFFGSYAAYKYLWIAGAIVGIGGLVLLCAGVYTVLFNRGLVKSLIGSFEAQKNQEWSDDVADNVKTAQGKFQGHIASARKRLIIG